MNIRTRSVVALLSIVLGAVAFFPIAKADGIVLDNASADGLHPQELPPNVEGGPFIRIDLDGDCDIDEINYAGEDLIVFERVGTTLVERLRHPLKIPFVLSEALRARWVRTVILKDENHDRVPDTILFFVAEQEQIPNPLRMKNAPIGCTRTYDL